MKTTAIVLYAGASTRFDAKKSKQVYLLKNKPVFAYSLIALAKSKHVDELVVVLNKEVEKEIRDFIRKNKINATVVLGGKTRQESVERGLRAISETDIVLIHDGARPLIDDKIIERVIAGAISNGASTAYVPETDSVVLMNKSVVKEYLNRSQVAKIQTPQAFQFNILKLAHKKAKKGLATDDCQLAKSIGVNVKLVLGSEKYHKITTLEDIEFLEGFLK